MIEVYPDEDIVINPRSEAIIPASILDYDIDMGRVLVLEDTTEDDGEDIYAVARAIVRVSENGRTMVQILNPTAAAVHINREKPIAIASVVGEIRTMEEAPEADWPDRLPNLPQDVPADFRPSQLVDLSDCNFTEEEK
uniref:Uncharacterized protein n=1 Tax=Caenorhabditis japonica TaxID=281687 RepID=A0A8R1ED07_CAEJA